MQRPDVPCTGTGDTGRTRAAHTAGGCDGSFQTVPWGERRQPPDLSPLALRRSSALWNPSCQETVVTCPPFCDRLPVTDWLEKWKRRHSVPTAHHSERPLFRLTLTMKINTRADSQAIVHNTERRCWQENPVFSHDLARETSRKFVFVFKGNNGTPNVIQHPRRDGVKVVSDEWK